MDKETKEKIINEIIKQIKENYDISQHIVNYGEWNHTDMWKNIEPIIKEIMNETFHLNNQ